MKTLSLILITGILLMISCKKESTNSTLNQEVESVIKDLKSKMDVLEFSEIDKHQFTDLKYNGENIGYVFKSKNVKAKSLYYGTKDNIITVNWVEFIDKKMTGATNSMQLRITDIHGKLLNNIFVKDGKAIKNNLNQKKNSKVHSELTLDPSDPSDPIEINLPDVIVTGYIHNNSIDTYGLYWLFNMNILYASLYSITSDNTNVLNGGVYNYTPNLSDYSTHRTKAVETVMQNGNIQVTSSAPAFILTELDIKFEYDPSTMKLNTESFSSKPTGLFLGNWIFSKIENIAYIPNTILFQYTYINSYTTPFGLNLNKPYSMNINYDKSTKTVYWTWL